MQKPLFDYIRSMVEQQFNQVTVPEDKRPLMKKYSDEIMNVLEKQTGWANMKGDYISMYTETFTEDEIKAVVAFYNTQAGQAYLQKLPVLMKKATEISQKKMPEMMDRMKQITSEMIEEMKSEIEKKSVEDNNQRETKGM